MMLSTFNAIDRPIWRNIGLVCVADAIVGLSFGAIAVSGGLDPWVPIAMSLLVFAGGAQFAALGVVLAGGSPWAGVLAGLILNTRLIAFGFSAADILGGPWWKRVVGAHLLTDETLAFALGQTDPALRRAIYWGSGIGLFIAWNIAVAIGAFVGGAIGDTDMLGLDAAFPIVLLTLVLPSLSDAKLRNAALFGAAIAVAASPFLPPGLSVLMALAGVVWLRGTKARKVIVDSDEDRP